MFALVHFSRSFPYIHPYLFPVETKPAQAASPVTLQQAAPDCNEAAAAPADGSALAARGSAGKRLKILHRRHLRSDILTYSGVPRRA